MNFWWLHCSDVSKPSSYWSRFRFIFHQIQNPTCTCLPEAFWHKGIPRTEILSILYIHTCQLVSQQMYKNEASMGVVIICLLNHEDYNAWWWNVQIIPGDNFSDEHLAFCANGLHPWHLPEKMWTLFAQNIQYRMVRQHVITMGFRCGEREQERERKREM